MKSAFIGALALLFGAAGPLAVSASGLAWDQKPDSLALLKDGQIVWRFNYGGKEIKPNFHPLAVAGGPMLSCYQPKDHPWHRGLWFSWKYVNKVNYWEESKKTGLPEGVTAWKAPEVHAKPDFSARFVLDLNYHPSNGPVVLTEHRVITVSAPDQAGGYHLDWDMTFRAAATALLDRAPPVDENGVNRSGGYAGLGIRGAEDLRDAQVATSEGPVEYENHRFRGRAPALDFSGVADGRAGGVAFLDDSANLNSPTPWYVINAPPMYYISPAVITYHPQTLETGETLALRYRVVVHPDRLTPEQLRQASAQYKTDLGAAR
ncbi:MAG TPA: PmoA family protein [Verrucomicrobiae bacterium]